jgi:hypothetical protein
LLIYDCGLLIEKNQIGNRQSTIESRSDSLTIYLKKSNKKTAANWQRFEKE